MDILLWIVVSFGAGFWIGRQNKKAQRSVSRKPEFTHPSHKASAPSAPGKCMLPQPRYQHSRWEDKNELFWGMVDRGVTLKNRKYLTTRTEWDYLKNLEEWFGQTCTISCQVSPGRFLSFPEQAAFSAEERARFFTLFNAMSVDYVLVSRITNQIVCVIELDDKSHEQEDRINRDKRLEQLANMAGILLIRVSVDEMDTKPPVWERRRAMKETGHLQ